MDKIKLKKPDGTEYPAGKIVKLKEIIIPMTKTSHKVGDASDIGKYIFYNFSRLICIRSL